jgi:hypothetical protein
MRRSILIALLAACGASLGSAPIAAQATCGVSIVWCVFVNETVRPPHIGVARGTYQAPGWYKLWGPYAEPYQAWRAACQAHLRRTHHSPDIAAGRIDCAACARGPAGCAR